MRTIIAVYPRQFWLLLAGTLINTTGGAMVWPFLTIYMRQRLQVPLTIVTLLLTANSVASLVATSVAGPAVDRFGRKGSMVLGLALGGASMLALILANSLGWFLIIGIISGVFGSLLRVGADAMVADLTEPEQRADAYALVRVVHNLGVAIGPAAGGFVAMVSYSIAFGIAAGASLAFCLIVLLFMAETIPKAATNEASPGGGGYGPILQDRPFLTFIAVYTLAVMVAAVMFVLLPVYVKEGFGLPENQYGFIMATNATMVVLFQYAVTRWSSRYSPLPILALGSLFYALGAGSVAWDWDFPTFWLSMVVLTIGEMLLVPTSTALTANLAPPDMRGRYMGVYNLTWGIAFGLGPVIGGVLNDRIAPAAIWHAALAFGLAAMLGFVLMALRSPQHPSCSRRTAPEQGQRISGPPSVIVFSRE